MDVAAFSWRPLPGRFCFTTNPAFYFGNFEFRAKMLLLLLAGINMAVFEFHTIKTWCFGTSAIPAGLSQAGGHAVAGLWLSVITFGR